MKKSVFFGALAIAGLTAGVATAQSTLEQVQERGTLQCGSNEGLAGFAAPDANGNWEGLRRRGCAAPSRPPFWAIRRPLNSCH